MNCYPGFKHYVIRIYQTIYEKCDAQLNLGYLVKYRPIELGPAKYKVLIFRWDKKFVFKGVAKFELKITLIIK